MVFSSTVFIFIFLPLVLGLYFFPWPWLGLGKKENFAASNAWKNAVLLIGSIAFYTWGELGYVAVMFVTALISWAAALGISSGRFRKAWLVFGILGNLSLLAYFKYGSFVYENLIALIPQLGPPLVPLLKDIHLPIGVSFFTFQALSYVIDVYRGEVAAQRNVVTVLLYKSFFPQLIAGPIVRYKDVARELQHRLHSVEGFNCGVHRFIIGLSQKVLIANQLGAVADQLYQVPPANLPCSLAWIAALAYSFQIYYDFAGYSNMAIGMARMFGLHFLENFDHPYAAVSVSDFWRRWHISLSTWFRDYLYIPLGGNRRGAIRTYFNLIVVFLLCGLWHGANWHFVAWGAYHGLLLILERLPLGRKLESLPRILRHALTLALVVFGWVLFRVETLGDAVLTWARMLGLGGGMPGRIWQEVITPEIALAFIAAAIFSFPLPFSICKVTGRVGPAQFLLFILALSYLAAGTFNPFIYFRF